MKLYYIIYALIHALRSLCCEPRSLRAAYNEGVVRFEMCAFNEALPNPAGDGPQWVRLCPWGDYQNKVGLQRVRPGTVRELLTTFNEAKQAAGSNWPGFPIYEGHPDTEGGPQRGWLNKARIGAWLDVQARADGLYVLREWNEDGLKNVRNRKFPYPSVHWNLRPQSDDTLWPAEPISIGMVEVPCMGKHTAWNEEDSETDHLPPTLSHETTNPPTHTMDLKALAASLGLPETATAEECLAKIKELLEASTEAVNTKEQLDTTKSALNEAERKLAEETGKVTALNEKVTTETGKVTALNERLGNSLVLIAVNEGRLTPSEQAAHVAAFNEDPVKAEAALKKLPVRFNTTPVKVDAGATRKTILGVNEATDKFNVIVAAHAEASKKPWAAAFNECWVMSEHSNLVAAISQPAA